VDAGLALPAELPRPRLEPAAFDPFEGVKPPAPPVAVAAPQVAVVPAPTPPPLSYRFLGRVKDPDGRTHVYLSHEGKDLPVAKGSPLDEGYVVERLEADAVLVYYPPLDFHTQIRIPLADAIP